MVKAYLNQVPGREFKQEQKANQEQSEESDESQPPDDKVAVSPRTRCETNIPYGLVMEFRRADL